MCRPMRANKCTTTAGVTWCFLADALCFSNGCNAEVCLLSIALTLCPWTCQVHRNGKRRAFGTEGTAAEQHAQAKSIPIMRTSTLLSPHSSKKRRDDKKAILSKNTPRILQCYQCFKLSIQDNQHSSLMRSLKT